MRTRICVLSNLTQPLYLLKMLPDLYFSVIHILSGHTGMAFVVCLLGALLLYTGYWLALPGFDFYSTIKYMCILFPCLLLVGRRALGFLIDNDNRGEQRKRV